MSRIVEQPVLTRVQLHQHDLHIPFAWQPTTNSYHFPFIWCRRCS